MIDRHLGISTACDCGETHRVDIRTVRIGRGVLESTGELAKDLGWRGPLMMVADPQTLQAAGDRVSALLKQAGFDVSPLVLQAHPVASPDTVAYVKSQVGAATALVAVGSGTINDIVKSAASDRGLPYLVVGTALSMNGYTSSISALLDGGIKRTLQTQPAQAVVLDLDVCAAAPRTMTLAGLGDMLSKPFSEADWRLASRVDGGYHCTRPGNILNEAFQRMIADATGIGQNDPNALESLAQSIALSGISMAMAGVSSPASGGEHLISHYWDMMRYGIGEHPFALHGTQVGAACCMVEGLHHRLQRVSVDDVDVATCIRDWPETQHALAERVRARHSNLPPDVVPGVIEQAIQKWRPPQEQRERMERLRGNLATIRTFVGEALLKEGVVRQALVDAGGTTDAGQVNSSLAGGLERWHMVRDIRSRYTILDLAAELGWFASP
jgi:glycerol-1-phosphate dehydrogenase [NAD(P)+]